MTPAGDDTDISSLPQADQDAIGATLISLMTGFRERDAEKLTGIYASDADWVNAFGTVKKGGDEIVEYLRGLFSDHNFNAGTLKAPPETALRVLTPEVVLVSAHLQVEGQKLVGGGEIAERDNHSLRVLQRQDDGSWLIVSDMFNDANRTNVRRAFLTGRGSKSGAGGCPSRRDWVRLPKWSLQRSQAPSLESNVSWPFVRAISPMSSGESSPAGAFLSRQAPKWVLALGGCTMKWPEFSSNGATCWGEKHEPLPTAANSPRTPNPTRSPSNLV